MKMIRKHKPVHIGSIDFVKAGMTFGEIMEYIGPNNVGCSEMGHYQMYYEHGEYGFRFSTQSNFFPDDVDPENLVADFCSVYKLRQ